MRSPTPSPTNGQAMRSPLADRRILVVEDTAELCSMIATLIAREGGQAVTAADGAAYRRCLAEETPDLILLDIGLPDADGLEILRALRLESEVPVILLSGRDAPIDRIMGLELGADDYLTKPFEPQELVARIKSVLRRSRGFAALESSAGKTLDLCGLSFDPAGRRLLDASGEELGLTTGEFDLLAALVEAHGRPLSRDQLLERTRDRDWSPFDRSVDVLIGRLRRKLAAVLDRSQASRVVQTVRGVGYRLGVAIDAPAAPATASGINGTELPRPDAAPR